MGRQRLILVNGRFLSQPITGVQRYAREVVSELAKLEPDNYKVLTVCASHHVNDNKYGGEIFFDHAPFSGVLWEQIRLPLLMSKFKADLLWSPCNTGPVLVEKQVVTIHDASFFVNEPWFSKAFTFYYRLVVRLLGRKARMVLTDSNFSKEELVKYGVTPIDKIRSIPAGVAEKFRHVKNRLFDFPYVLTVGSRDPRKNITRLIHAWQILPPQARQNRKLVIAGGRAKVFGEEKLSALPEDVIFADYVNDEDMPALYSGADAFVYPSLYEGFGLPPLEAMACGCPVIVSNVASLPEVCEGAAHYVDPYHVQDIADGLCRVLTEKTLRTKLVQRGYEHVKRFTWVATARKTLQALIEVMDVGVLEER